MRDGLKQMTTGQQQIPFINSNLFKENGNNKSKYNKQRILEQVVEISIRIFTRYDYDKSESIDSSELMNMLNDLYTEIGIREKVSKTHVNKIFKRIDTNYDNQISLTEFVNFVQLFVNENL